jgi:uncharacterized repeat protein (TIGR01451 family)
MTTQALVIGAGGLTGIAWEAGVLQGLADTGIPVTGWDLVIGSSAGAYVGARLLAEGSTGPIYRAQLEAEAEAETQALATVTGRLPIWLIRAARPPGLSFLARAGVAPLALRAVAAQAARHGPRELGTLRVILRSRRPSGSAADSAQAMARLARANSAPEDVWIGYWRRALGPVTEWPSAPLVMTAVAIDDGSRAVIQHPDGVPLAQALPSATPTLPSGVLEPSVAGLRFSFTNSNGEFVLNPGSNFPDSGSCPGATVCFNVTPRLTLRSTGAPISFPATFTDVVTAGGESPLSAPNLTSFGSAPAPLTVIPGTPQLGVTKAASPKTVPPGVPVDYTLTTTNTGAAAIPGLTITEPLPAGLVFNASFVGTGGQPYTISSTVPPGADPCPHRPSPSTALRAVPHWCGSSPRATCSTPLRR